MFEKAKIFIWDEAPMCNKLCLETVDRFLRGINKQTNKKRNWKTLFSR